MILHLFLVIFWPILILILFISGIVVINIPTIFLALEISILGILVPLTCYSVMIRDMEKLDDRLDYWFFLITDSSRRPGLEGYALVKLYWYYGRFEDAYQIVQGKKESEILNEETPSTVKVVWGWRYYQESNLLKLTEILEYLSQKEIDSRDEED